MRKITVALNLPRTALELLARARHIAACMTGNPYFPSPPLALSTLVEHIDEADAAQGVTTTGLHGAATARDAKVAVVRGDLEQLRNHVQGVAREHGPDAPAVVVSAGMYVKESAGPSKASFSGKNLARSGSVKLEIRDPGVESSCGWQSSTDGITWDDQGTTTYKHKVLEGLTPGVIYWFRVRVLTPEGLGDWSSPIKLMVL